ncbi:MAG: hypothetical protein ACRDIE_05000, partial [Chloroflexota bacterium]
AGRRQVLNGAGSSRARRLAGPIRHDRAEHLRHGTLLSPAVGCNPSHFPPYDLLPKVDRVERREQAGR